MAPLRLVSNERHQTQVVVLGKVFDEMERPKPVSPVWRIGQA